MVFLGINISLGMVFAEQAYGRNGGMLKISTWKADNDEESWHGSFCELV